MVSLICPLLAPPALYPREPVDPRALRCDACGEEYEEGETHRCTEDDEEDEG